MSIELRELFSQLMDQHGYGVRGGQTRLALRILERDPVTTISRSRINMYLQGKYELSMDVLKYIMMVGLDYSPDLAEDVINKYIAVSALSEITEKNGGVKKELIDRIDELLKTAQQYDKDFSILHKGGARSTAAQLIPMYSSLKDAFTPGVRPAWYMPQFQSPPYPLEETIGATYDSDLMRPMIHRGEFVLIHKESPTILEHGKIYLFIIDGKFELKKVLKAIDGVYILSTNGDIPEITLTPQNRDRYPVKGRIFFILKAT